MKVAKHFIGAPTTNKANDVGVDTSTKKGHSAASTETAGGDAKGVDAKRKVEGGGTETKHSSNTGGGNGGRLPEGRKER